MIKFILYLPVHIFNTVLALTPRNTFIAGYQPSSDVIRHNELAMRNRVRLLQYNLTK